MYFVFCIKYFVSRIGVVLLVLFILNTKYQILDTPTAFAQSISLGIDPPIIQLIAKPNTTIKEEFTVSNFADSPVRLDITLKPFTARATENGEVEYTTTDSSFITSNVTITDGVTAINSVVLVPNEEKKLLLEITIPEKETAADYYFSVLFISNTSVDATGEFSGHAITAAGIGMNVLLSIDGEERPQAKIEEFSSPIFVEKGPVPFTVRLTNPGNHVITPTGTIIIKNMFGQAIGKVDLSPTNILAHSTRAIADEIQVSEPEAAEKYKILNTQYEIPRAYWYESFLLGPYTATLTVVASEQGPTLTHTTYFFAFPATGILGVLAAILILFSIRARVNKKLGN